MAGFLLGLGVLGSLTSSIYTLMVFAGIWRFVVRRRRAKIGYTPPVSLLKPLHGAEPDLTAYLESFFRQDYPSYEILFCARWENDPGLQIAREVAGRHPEVPVQFLTSGEPPWPNARCFSLEVMRKQAKHEFLIISDSDVRVAKDYLRSIMSPFADPEVGLVTCLYRGVSSSGLWARLEAMGMSVEMTGGVLVAEMLEGMKFALGPTMVVRKQALTAIGNFPVLGEYHADDFMLGNLVAASGSRVVLSTHSIEHHIVNTSFRGSMKHQLGWMKSTRFSRPKGHFGTVLTYAMPFGLLAAGAGMASGHAWIGFACLIVTFLLRTAMSALVGGLVVEDKVAVTQAWLYPLRDLFGFFFWAGSYFGRTVRWRDDVFRLGRNGLMEKLGKS
jgi:ceramide glucosyltransferase